MSRVQLRCRRPPEHQHKRGALNTNNDHKSISRFARTQAMMQRVFEVFDKVWQEVRGQLS